MECEWCPAYTNFLQVHPATIQAPLPACGVSMVSTMKRPIEFFLIAVFWLLYFLVLLIAVGIFFDFLLNFRILVLHCKIRNKLKKNVYFPLKLSNTVPSGAWFLPNTTLFLEKIVLYRQSRFISIFYLSAVCGHPLKYSSWN
jgi:hypothetical protein